MLKIWAISDYFDHFWSPCNGQHCSVGLLGEIWIELCPPNTLMLSAWLENHIESYALGENDESSSDFGPFWSFLKFMLGETLQLGLRGSYRLESSLSNTLSIVALLCSIRASPLQRKMRLFVRCSGTWVFLWRLKLSFFRILFHFFLFSLNFTFFSDLILIVLFSRTYIFFGL